MIGFSYTYKSTQEILESTSSLSRMSSYDILLVASSLVSVMLFIFIILPLCIIIYKHIIDSREKKNKKKLLTQILLQKEIEDEVEKEIHIDDEGSVT